MSKNFLPIEIYYSRMTINFDYFSIKKAVSQKIISSKMVSDITAAKENSN